MVSNQRKGFENDCKQESLCNFLKSDQSNIRLLTALVLYKALTFAIWISARAPSKLKAGDSVGTNQLISFTTLE